MLRMLRCALVAALAALALAASAQAGLASATAAGFHWTRPTQASALVTVIDNLPAAWHPLVLAAAADYSQAANLDVVVAGPQQCVTDAAMASPSWLGSKASLPVILDHNNVCLDAHSLAYYWGYTFWQPYNWTPENGSLLQVVEIWIDPARVSPNSVYGQYIVCHELGHALGLGHRSTSDTGSCMSENYWTPANPHPDASDLAMIDQQTTVLVTKPKPCKKKKC